MPNSGYPTPDAQSGDVTYGCIPIIVPNNPEFQDIFASIIYGLYGQMSNEWFWMQQGTLSPELAAEYASKALALTEAYANCGATMTCDEIADCVESEIVGGNETLINVLTNNAISTGTGGNFNRVNADITTVLDRNLPQSLQESINPEFQCDMNKLWGAIRHGIVERLDDTARDLLEDLAAINDTPQRFQAFIDVIPVLGDVAEGIVTLATEVIPDILNLYDSYSSEAVLDEIACDLFALVCNDCALPTFEQLYNYYSTLGYEMSAMNAQTLAPMMQKIAGMIGTFQPASIVYHSMITFQLFTLYLQATWNGNSGVATIHKWAKLGEDFGSDNWVDLCDACNEQYQVFEWDYTVSQYDSVKASGFSTSGGTWIAGKGWRVDKTAANAGRLTMGQPFDPSWEIRSIIVQTDKPRADWTNYAVVGREIVGSGTAGYNMTLTVPTDANSRCRTGILSQSAVQEMAISIIRDPYVEMYLRKLIVIFNVAKSPQGSRTTSNDDACILS